MNKDAILKLRDFLMARLAEKNTNIFMEAHLEELIAVCNAALRSPAWIPVSERLPEVKDWYSVIDADGERRSALFIKGAFIGQIMQPVKAWAYMPPLPAAPSQRDADGSIPQLQPSGDGSNRGGSGA